MDFFKKYCVRIFSVFFIGLAICEICFMSVYKKNNTFMCINIILNFIFGISGFLYPLNPFYNFNESYESFLNLLILLNLLSNNADTNSVGYSVLKVTLLKLFLMTIISCAGIAIIITKQHTLELMPLFIIEIIINGISPVFTILKLTKNFLSTLFFPEIMPTDESFEQLSPIRKHIQIYKFRYATIWAYFLCGYEIFATYKIYQDEYCVHKGAIAMPIIILIINFLFGTALVFLPLNYHCDNGNDQILPMCLMKLVPVTLLACILGVSIGCPNIYLISVVLIEPGLHFGLPIVIYFFGYALYFFVLALKCLCKKIMFADDLIDLQNNFMVQNQLNELIEPIEPIQQIQPIPIEVNNNYIVVNKFDNSTCPICLSEIDRNKSYAILHCSHIYCEECVKKFAKTQNNGIKCSLCEQITNINNV